MARILVHKPWMPKDFSADSQRDLTRAQFRLWRRLLSHWSGLYNTESICLEIQERRAKYEVVFANWHHTKWKKKPLVYFYDLCLTRLCTKIWRRPLLLIRKLKQRHFWTTHYNRKWGLFSFNMPWRGCATAVQFILFNFANYSPSIAMELKVSKEITCKWQNQRSETNKYIWLLSIIFEVASSWNSRDQLWKTVRLNSFQKP